MIEIAISPLRKKWTRDELHAIGESGAIDITRLELIDGDLLNKSGENFRHVQARHQITIVLYNLFGMDQVTPGHTIEVACQDRAGNEPEPDISVLNRSFEMFQDWPQPDELLLVVEVSDTTLRFDLGPRAALYARAGIVEYWVADLNERRLVVHRQPEQGRYTSVVSYAADESVTPLAAPHASVLVASLFPNKIT